MRGGWVACGGVQGLTRAFLRVVLRSRLTKWREMGATGDGAAFRAFFLRNGAKVKERVRKGCAHTRADAQTLADCSRAPLASSRTHAPRIPAASPTSCAAWCGSCSREAATCGCATPRATKRHASPHVATSSHPASHSALPPQLLTGTSACEVDIIRDVSRTYPHHIHFCQRHGLGQRQLFRVLKAYALYDPVVGYVQGMAYIAAIFLMYMGEEEAFWLLVALLKGAGGNEPLEGLFTDGLPLVQLCLFQLEGLVQVR